MRKILSIIILVASFSASALAHAETGNDAAETLDKFLLINKCAVASMIQQIHQHAPTDDHMRYLILEAEGTNGYVQCVMHDNDTAIYCEAASGYYFKSLKISASGLSTIARHGFSTDASKGNFNFDVPITGSLTFDDIADRMLQTLYRAYNAHTDHIDIKAPLIFQGKRRLPTAVCLIS